VRSFFPVPDVVWPLTWAALGTALAACGAFRARLHGRRARRARALVRRFDELRAGEPASIGGTLAATARHPGAEPFEIVMEGGERVRVEPERRAAADEPVDDDLAALAAERPVYASGIVTAGAHGFTLRPPPGERMGISGQPLWRRPARRRVYHLVFAAAIAAVTVECVAHLAWDHARLALGGRVVVATLSNERRVRERRFRLSAWGFEEVEKSVLDATYVDEGGRQRQFTTKVDPDAEWIWPVRVDAESRQRLGIEPARQPFVILPDEPSVHQLGTEPRLDGFVALGPLAFLAAAAVFYGLVVVRPEIRGRGRLRRHPPVVRQSPA
jgi:hypothetical protein